MKKSLQSVKYFERFGYFGLEIGVLVTVAVGFAATGSRTGGTRGSKNFFG